MLRPPCVRSRSRRLARPLAGVEDQPHFPQLKASRRDPVHRPIQARGELGIRRVGKGPKCVEHLLLLLAEVLAGAGVCPE